MQEYGRPPSSQLTPNTSNNSSRSHSSIHFPTSSQTSPPPLSVLGDGSGPYSDAPQLPSPLQNLPYAYTQTTPLPIPQGVHFPVPPPRRHSETDMRNAQNALMTLNPLEHQPAPSTYPPFPDQSGPLLRSSSAQRVPPGFMTTFPGPSSPARGGSSPLANSVSSHMSDHSHPSPATTPSVNWQQERTRRAGKGRRAEPPKDPRATHRLSDQRKSDDENIEALCKLFVPPGAEVKWKKDRLDMSALSFV